MIISDQSESGSSFDSGEVQTAIRLLELKGFAVQARRHLPRRGLAEQRAFLLAEATAEYVLFVDDDLILEPTVTARLLRVIREQCCGFVGAAPIGLSYCDDVRPEQQAFELWQERVRPECFDETSNEWQRHRLHNAANLLHVQQALGLGRMTACLTRSRGWEAARCSTARSC